MSNDPTTKIPVPKVVIDRMALEKIKYFVNKDTQECSGMGITRVVGDTIYVDDVQMLEQRNGAAHTDINEQAVTKLMYEWRERVGEINFWWHSHVNMNVFWSYTDEQTIKQLAQHGMCVASVFNKKGEIRTAVACKIDLPFSGNKEVVTFDNLPLLTQFDISAELKAAWDAEHEANVKKLPVYNPSFQQGGRGAQRHLGFHGDSTAYDHVEFFPCPTTDPEHWDTFHQACKYDTDFTVGSSWDPAFQKYRKSKDYLDQYKEWEGRQKVLGQGNPSTPSIVPGTGNAKTSQGVITGETGKKWKFAEENEEIVQYDSVFDMFVLNTGRKVDAVWYMSDGAEIYRNNLKSETEFLKEQIKEYEDSLMGRDTKEQPISEAEVQKLKDEGVERMSYEELQAAYWGGDC